MDERRRTARFATGASIVFEGGYEALIRNMSPGGILVTGKELPPLEVGDEVHITTSGIIGTGEELPAGESLWGQGRVVRRSMFEIAIGFEKEEGFVGFLNECACGRDD